VIAGIGARTHEADGGESTNGVFITGATGFLGMALLARYLQHTDRRVFALVRADSDRQAATRLKRTLLSLFGHGHPYEHRAVAVRGDVTRSGVGLGRRREGVAEQVSEIVHGAATVSFSLGLDASRAVNVEGTRQLLQFAALCQAHGGLRRFSHISTAYVAGEHSGCFSEDDLDLGQSFRNGYEQSKFEAECLVASWRERLPITVLRPGIIVGERDTGWTASFNVLYWPLRAFARGTYAALPGRRDARVDVVPVDWVADATFALSQAPDAEDATFHLTAGDQASTVGEIATLAGAFFSRAAPRLIDPALYTRVLHPVFVRAAPDERSRRALRRSELFFPYFAMKARYDDRRCRIALRGTGIRLTPLREYFDRLMQFAIAADWGRRHMGPAVAAKLVSAPPARATAGSPQVQAQLVPVA
jgi:long-chain acyl-CoA synthetase